MLTVLFATACTVAEAPSAVDLVAATVEAQPTAEPDPTPRPTPVLVGLRTWQRLNYGDAPAQYGRLMMPAEARTDSPTDYPMVVLIHGGFWKRQFDASQMFPIAEWLAARGIASWNIEMTLVGNPDGGWPGTLNDVAAAIDYLAVLAEDHPISLDDVRLLGHSSGGHLALWAHARDQLAAGEPGANPAVTPTRTVALGPITDLVWAAGNGEATAQFLGGAPTEVPDRYAHATPIFDPVTSRIVVAEFDRLVLPGHYQNAIDAGVPITPAPDADHFDLIDPGSPTWDVVIAELLGP